jgi:hypothetical protein
MNPPPNIAAATSAGGAPTGEASSSSVASSFSSSMFSRMRGQQLHHSSRHGGGSGRFNNSNKNSNTSSNNSNNNKSSRRRMMMMSTEQGGANNDDIMTTEMDPMMSIGRSSISGGSQYQPPHLRDHHGGKCRDRTEIAHANAVIGTLFMFPFFPHDVFFARQFHSLTLLAVLLVCLLAFFSCFLRLIIVTPDDFDLSDLS